MNIVVCVKQVIDTSIPIDVDSEAKSIINEGLVYVVNPYDKVAVEEAVRIKQELGVGEVSVVCLGSSSAKKALRRCLAMGADRAVLICDPGFDGSNSYAVATVLATAIGQLKYDLILCGVRATDTNAGQVGPVIADMLDIPLVYGVTKIAVSANRKKIVTHRKVEGGKREIVEAPLPALVAVEAGLNEPRYATLPSLIVAQRKQIEECNMNELGLSLNEVGSKGSKITILKLSLPRPRPKKPFSPDGSLSAAERLGQVMSGGITEKHGTILHGDVASEVVCFLKQNIIN